MAARTSSSGSKRCRLVAPNAVYTERVASAETTLDGSYLACAVAGMLCSLNYSSSATHKTVSVDDLSILVSTGKKYYNKVEQEQVLQSGIIPVTLMGILLITIVAAAVIFHNVNVDITVGEALSTVSTAITIPSLYPGETHNESLTVSNAANVPLNATFTWMEIANDNSTSYTTNMTDYSSTCTR